MAKAGRKSKYKTHVEPVLDKIAHWRKQGLTEEQVALKCGVAYSTFRTYIKQFPALISALKKAKEDLVIELEKSLYKRAIGYEYEETEVVVTKNEDGSSKPMKVVKKKKHIIPDVGAIIFALTNLAPEAWENTQVSKHKQWYDKEKLKINTEELELKKQKTRPRGEINQNISISIGDEEY